MHSQVFLHIFMEVQTELANDLLPFPCILTIDTLLQRTVHCSQSFDAAFIISWLLMCSAEYLEFTLCTEHFTLPHLTMQF